MFMTCVLGLQRVKIGRVIYRLELFSQPQIPASPPLRPTELCTTFYEHSAGCSGKKM